MKKFLFISAVILLSPLILLALPFIGLRLLLYNGIKAINRAKEEHEFNQGTIHIVDKRSHQATLPKKVGEVYYERHITFTRFSYKTNNKERSAKEPRCFHNSKSVL